MLTRFTSSLRARRGIRRAPAPAATFGGHRFAVSAACFFLSAFVWTGALAAAEPSAPAEPVAGPAPRLTVDSDSYSSGEVARDSVVEHTFVLKNEGQKTLEISKIVTTSNVTLNERPTQILPGATFRLHARVELLNERPGGILKNIEIQTNDPVRPTLKLEMRIIAVEYVKATPAKARWISVQQEADGTISPVLSAIDGKPFRVLSVSSPPPGISMSYGKVAPAAPAAPAEGTATPAAKASAATTNSANPPTSASPADAAAAGDKWKIDLTLSKSAPVGAIVGNLLVQVDHPKQKVVPIPLSGFMRPVVHVTPYELKLADLTQHSVQTHELHWRNFATEEIRVTRVEHNLPGFGEATVTTTKEGRIYKVSVPMDLTKVPKGPLKGAIRIHTDSAKAPVFVLPVEGEIK